MARLVNDTEARLAYEALKVMYPSYPTLSRPDLSAEARRAFYDLYYLAVRRPRPPQDVIDRCKACSARTAASVLHDRYNVWCRLNNVRPGTEPPPLNPEIQAQSIKDAAHEQALRALRIASEGRLLVLHPAELAGNLRHTKRKAGPRSTEIALWDGILHHADTMPFVIEGWIAHLRNGGYVVCQLPDGTYQLK